MKLKDFILILIFLIGCRSLDPDNLKTLDVNQFEIEVPETWEYKSEKGIDSFVGRIVGNGVEFYFDLSRMGYANHLIPTMYEYIYENSWQWIPEPPPYMKEGVIYTSGNPIGDRDRIMKERGITDSTKVKVEKFQIPKKEIQLINGQYKATLTYKDTIQIVDIEIPEEISAHRFQVDTIGTYYRKIIRPKEGIEGMTGVYFQELKSSFNFNLVARNLSKKNQDRAIQAFKTIKIKGR